VKTAAGIGIDVVEGDVLTYGADVFALKFARSLYGVDFAVVERLREIGNEIDGRLPPLGDHLIVESRGVVAAPNILFLGVQPLGRFDYAEIRKFGRDVLIALAESLPQTETLALTLHGRGFGLDEGEAFRAEVAGLLDAIGIGDFPSSLRTISIVERDLESAQRLSRSLATLLPTGRVGLGVSIKAQESADAATMALENVGQGSKAKPYVFVAMPFAAEFNDRFHYGISNAANSAGYLCERADLASFTGDVISWVRERIDKSVMVIADLSTANPNVYLEVGYAWGRGVKTILLAPSTSELRFDVRGQRCLVFDSIRHLEDLLTRELTALRGS
jgi:hypothetical protein